MDDNENLLDINLDIDFSKENVKSFDYEKFTSEKEELDEILNYLPKDNIFLDYDYEVLEAKTLRGWQLCIQWLPILNAVLSVVQIQRDKAKNNAYINAENKESKKMTAELRKAYSEIDEEFLRLKKLGEMVKSSMLFLENQKEYLKANYYRYRKLAEDVNKSDKNNISSIDNQLDSTTPGKVGW